MANRWWVLPLKLIFTIGPAWLVWTNIEATPGLESERFGELWSSLGWGWMALALLSLAVSNLTGCAQWRMLLARQGIAMGYVKLLRIYFVGLFFNNFMPGNVGGDIKKIYDIRADTGQRMGAGLSATIFDRLFGLFFLNGLALSVGFLFFVHDPEQRYLILPSLWVFIGFCLFFAGLFSKRFGHWLEILAGKLVPASIVDRFATLRDRFHLYRDPSLWLRIILLSGVTQALRVLVHCFCGYAIGVVIDVSWYFFYIPLVAVISALPLSIGGFGPREWLAQSLFAKAGVGGMESVLTQFLAYLVSLVLSLAGAVEFLSRRSSQPNRQIPDSH